MSTLPIFQKLLIFATLRRQGVSSPVRGSRVLLSAAGVIAAIGAGSTLAVPHAGAQATPPQQPAGADRVIADPPKIDIRTAAAPRSTLMRVPKEAPRMSGEKELDLTIRYIDGAIYNPNVGRKEPVRLRGYTGGDAARATGPLVAPTIEVYPGDTVRIMLRNALPADPGCAGHPADPNEPHCFNGTNLHTHGLWVSPAGNSDNVLLSVNPGVNFQFEYNIPPDHPAGTFWYHPHRHGSTALQVSSGMAGALIVRGDRLPTAEENGDIDTLLKNRDGSPLAERILVLQQIQYACLDAAGAIKVQRNSEGDVVGWVCEPGDTGGIEFYRDPGGNGLFGPGTWAQSGRFTSINGVVLPTFPAVSGQLERWRLIHAGVRDTISLEFRRLKADAPAYDALKAADAKRFIEDNCTGPAVPYHLVAADGLTMAAVRRTTQTVLQPGYRADALVVFPRPGKYCVINASVPASASVSRSAPSPRLLGVVTATPGRSVRDVGTYVRDALIAAARRAIPDPVRKSVVNDLQDGLRLTRFQPHSDVADDEISGRQDLTFNINTAAAPPRFEIDGAPYDPARVDRRLMLGAAEEWTLRAQFASHPFHIHVNPFQVVRILDPAGRDVSMPGAIDDAGGSPDPQYPGLKGVWKDTIWIKSLIPQNPDPAGIYTVVLRTRYQRYIGDFVLHCHILDHEDQGMMQNVRIDLPDGEVDTVHGHR